MMSNARTERATCGRGLAAQSVLPAQLAALTASLADSLDVHTAALDLTDANSRAELQVYRRLVTAYRQISAGLRSAADDMAAHRDLPMGRHDQRAMADPRVRDAFETYATIKQELRGMLAAMAVQDDDIRRSMPAV